MPLFLFSQWLFRCFILVSNRACSTNPLHHNLGGTAKHNQLTELTADNASNAFVHTVNRSAAETGRQKCQAALSTRGLRCHWMTSLCFCRWTVVGCVATTRPAPIGRVDDVTVRSTNQRCVLLAGARPLSDGIQLCWYLLVNDAQLFFSVYVACCMQCWDHFVDTWNMSI